MRKEAVRQEKADGRQRLSPPRLPDDDQLAVEAAQASVGDGEPAAWPPDATIPDARCPDKGGGDNATHEAHLLRAFNRPVYRPSNATSILSRRKVQLVTKEGDPERQDSEEEGVVSLPGAQLEELGAHGSLEDQEVEIYHGRGAGRVMQRVARLASTSAVREGACAGAGFGIGIGIAGSGLGNWGALDDGVEVVGHGLRAAADSGLGLGSGARGRGVSSRGRTVCV